MKKKLNVIQIRGIRGLILAGFVVTCLVAGFIVFPGWICMQLWNFIAGQFLSIPAIGITQGGLLWAIILTSYFVFRKEPLIVCMKSPQGLDEEELKAVFADIKKQSIEDPILQAMMKAREAELKYKAQQTLDNKESDKVKTNADSNNV